MKVLGEGGFSFVYLAQDEHSGASARPLQISPVLTRIPQRQFALKKIRCPGGNEDVRQAMREVEAYRRFKCVVIFLVLTRTRLTLQNVDIQTSFAFSYVARPTLQSRCPDDYVQDSAVVQDPAGDGQVVYLFLPLYKVSPHVMSPSNLKSNHLQRGNLQDAINANSINGTHFSEKEMLRLFKGTCEAIRAMHDYRASIASRSNPRVSRENQSSSADRRPQQPRRNIHADNGHSDDEDDAMLPQPEGDAEGGYSYHGPASRSSVPLISRGPDVGETIFDGDEELAQIQRSGAENGTASNETELVPYAHRDLKPGYVSIFHLVSLDISDCSLETS